MFYYLQKICETAVAVALIAAFGYVESLYVIFYAGAILGETIMEIWDPQYLDSKPSQVFILKQAGKVVPLPEQRSETKVLVLENWN